jgi:cellulose synthase/poly-beta-1,6-N-acetylglucosamine synthase-like glycosyltransferase
MDTLIDILKLIYLLLVIPLVLYALGTTYLLILFILNRHKRPYAPPVADKDLPCVTVQLPLYNERFVAERLIDAVAALDYPRPKLHIQVLDDSTDDTVDLVRERVSRLQAQGLRIDLIHRTDRTGYKAGALENGMHYTDGEFIAIFDADFIPAPDFLRRTVPYFFTDERVGVVQTRWGHLNADDNLLTRSEALMIDGHFAVEQFARSSGDLIFTFNGTCGLWRRKAIEDAGGWQHDTLTEDSDLSFRAQMKGWRFVFVPDVMVPGEVPPHMVAFKQQQARWAKGTTQVLLKLALPLLRSPLSIRKRLMGVLQLLPYPSQPLALAILLLMPALVVTRALHDLPLGPLGLLSVSIPALYVLSQQYLYDNWLKRSLVFPVLMAFSSGLSVNNSRAAISAFLGKSSEFKRTPKFNLGGGASGSAPGAATPLSRSQIQQYATLIDQTTLWELAFGLYSLFGAVVAAVFAPSMIPYFVLYVIGFFSVAIWSIVDRRSLYEG